MNADDNTVHDKLAEALARVAELEEALRPFAKSAEVFIISGDKGEFWIYRPAGGDEYALTGKDLLAARAALGQAK